MSDESTPRTSFAGPEHAREAARAEQNFPAALLVATCTSLIAAVLWAALTAATGYQIGYMAVGVGLMVGLAVRAVGKGIDRIFGILGASFSLMGCGVGNLLVGCVFLAKENQVSLLQVLSILDTQLAWDLMRAMFSPMDLLFYGIALYEGYRLSFQAIPSSPVGGGTA